MNCENCKNLIREEIFDGTDYAMADYCSKRNITIEDVKDCEIFEENNISKKENILDIDEQMHECNDWEENFFEKQAEFYEYL